MKTLKNLLLVGNDWLLHVVVGVFCYLFFEPLIGKIWSIAFSALSHPLVDMIPHGHVKSNILDGLKGILTGIILLIIVWIKIDFVTAFWTGVSIIFAIGFDFLLVLAKLLDKKIPQKSQVYDFDDRIVRLVMIDFCCRIIGFNFLMHWFGKAKIFSPIWKEKEIFNCGISGNGLKVNWWNITQLVIAIPFLFIIF
jgi:hypothetical protein